MEGNESGLLSRFSASSRALPTRPSIQKLLQFLDIGRLDEVSIKSGLSRLLLFVLTAIAGEGDQQRLLAAGQLAPAAGHPIAIDPRQPDVHNEHLRRLRSGE